MIRFDDHASGVEHAIYQLKITLRESKPPIWRRVLLRGGIRLDRLHEVIQRVMPRTNSHLHQFNYGGSYFGVPDPDYDSMDMEMLDEKRYRLADPAPAEKRKFKYEYDFGDGWEHELLVEKVLPPDSAFKHPICVAGSNGCPPEDCGGIHGDYRMLKILANPKHSEHRQWKEWIGGEWNSDLFDSDWINNQLKRLKA